MLQNDKWFVRWFIIKIYNLMKFCSICQQQIDQAVTSISQKILTEPKPDTAGEISAEENINFSTVDSFMPSFSTTDSLVTNFSSVPSLTIDALSSEDSINSQYTIENLSQNINCDNLDQSMNSIENTSQNVEEGNSDISSVISSCDNTENSESQSETNDQKDLSGSAKTESDESQFQIESLNAEQSNDQISDSSSSDVSSLEISSLSGDMTGIIQIPYSANGLQIIPISGVGNNLFNFSTNGGISYPIQISHISSDDGSALAFSSQDGAVSDMQIDSSQMHISFANDDVDSTQLGGFSIKVNRKDDLDDETVQSNHISSEMSREEMESAMDESLNEGNLEDS